MSRRVAPAGSQLRTGLRAQLFIRNGEELLPCSLIPALRSLEQVFEWVHDEKGGAASQRVPLHP